MVGRPDSEDLIETLRAQLTEALGDLDNPEAAPTESLEPQTVEDVDELEERLNAALEELQKLRKDLEQNQ
jgi:ABC-type transporter Mla subunit MlaD